jgi:hypothetical protein
LDSPHHSTLVLFSTVYWKGDLNSHISYSMPGFRELTTSLSVCSSFIRRARNIAYLPLVHYGKPQQRHQSASGTASKMKADFPNVVSQTEGMIKAGWEGWEGAVAAVND